MTSSGSQGRPALPAPETMRPPSRRAISAAMVQNQASSALAKGSAAAAVARKEACPGRAALVMGVCPALQGMRTFREHKPQVVSPASGNEENSPNYPFDKGEQKTRA